VLLGIVVVLRPLFPRLAANVYIDGKETKLVFCLQKKMMDLLGIEMK
jgi:hypothetical protein